ncbi:hypothetical protein RB195_025209 [Necator americanus]|uniref:Uncharacterized protein n=1 Tax=Necator americanus TaxID=51031 RepID=A0ABR1ETF1_NECAM
MTTRGNMRLSASDKSEEFVVMSQALDREITNLHLQDETIYRRVTEKEFFVQCKCLNHVWMSGKSAGLDKRFVSRLKLDKPSCPVFYSLIKTSKLNPDEMNSTSAATFKIRPEISCVGGPTDRISWFLNKISITAEEQRKRKVPTFKLQLDYVLTKIIHLSDIRKSRAVWDVAFDSNQRPVLLSFMVWFHKRYWGAQHQPKLDLAAPRKTFAFASTETISMYNSVCVARNTGNFSPEKGLRKRLRRQLKRVRENEWTSRAKEFEKAWEDKNPRKAYTLLMQYSCKMKRSSPVLNTANGDAVGETNLPIWRKHFNTLLNRQAPFIPALVHAQGQIYHGIAQKC